MAQFVTDDEFDGFFRDGFQHTAWRLETQRRYDSDRQSETYRRFLRGEDPARDLAGPWLANMRLQTGRGKRVERVRILDDPPTEGQQYLLTGTPYNLAAGEDIRHLDRAKAVELKLPMVDFWLFDSRVMLELHFDEEVRYLGAERIEDPVRVLKACQVRDAAWHYATRYERHVGPVPSIV